MNWYKLDKKYAITCFLLSLLSLLYVFPVILMNLYFKDDMGWSLVGSIGLKGDGRPLGEYLVLALSGGEPITDTAPLPLILAILFLSYTLTLYAKANLDFVSNPYAQLIVLLPITTNPFAVECLSYRYGSMVMFVALALPFIMFSMPNTISNMKCFIYSSLLSMAVMSLYQAAIGMCLVLFIVHIFLRHSGGGKSEFVHEGLLAAGIGTGVILYMLIIPGHYISTSDWRYSASQTMELTLGSFIAIFKNIVASCQYITSFLSEAALWYQIALALIIILTILSTAIIYYRESKTNSWRKIIALAFLIISPACILISSFLPLMLLQKQMLKLRIFIALGGFLFYLGILLLCFMKKHPRVLQPLLFLLILCNLYHYTYIYSYGNAVNNHTEYAKYIVYHVAHDLETINADKTYHSISFIGTMPKSHRTQTICEKYPITGALLPKYFTNDTWIGGAHVLHYLQDDLAIEKETDADMEIVESAEPIMENSIYSCYVNVNKIIIVFHETASSSD